MPHKRKELNIEGPNLWYLVGLITTDGCLSSDGRHIDITSKDYNFVRGIINLTGGNNKIGVKYGFKKQKAFRVQIANRNFYDLLLSIGLTQNKSLTLSEIKVPKQFFVDFLRGVIDGDGCIRSWIHPSNNGEQWSLRIYSGSQKFIDWLHDSAEQLLKIRGKMHKNATNTWVLKYGKMAAKEIIKHCYYKNCFGLDRKIELAYQCYDAPVGWTKSKTVAIAN